MTEEMRPDDPMAYVAVSIGGAIGIAAGIGGGWGAARALEQPEAGMANLALLFIPFVLLAIAQPVGTFVALRLVRHPDASAVAVLAGVFTLALAMFSMKFLRGWTFVLGLALIVAAPALALHLRRRAAPYRPLP
jgi:Mn2+/Fe2+ NRAMP family transporter